MLRELTLRSRDDLIVARELVRDLARSAGCSSVVETRLVAGLSDLVERLYHGTTGRIRIQFEDALLEAILEHDGSDYPADGRLEEADSDAVLLAIGSVRYLWDEIAICRELRSGLKVKLRSWLK